MSSLSVAHTANDAEVFAQFHAVFGGDIRAEDALTSEQEIVEECNAAVASHTAFRNFCILAKGGVEFLVDGVLAISLCGAFEDVVKGEKSLAPPHIAVANFPLINAFWMNLIVQFMYLGRYDLFQSNTPACPETEILRGDFEDFSPLLQHAFMYTHGVALRAPLVQAFALRHVLELLAEDLTISDFVGTAQFAFEVREAPEMLKRVLVTCAAHMEESWVQNANGAAYWALYAKEGFRAMMLDVKREMLEMKA